MKVILIVFALFLIAFAGLGAGLLLKRKGLKGSCGSAADAGHDCHCRSDKSQPTTSQK